MFPSLTDIIADARESLKQQPLCAGKSVFTINCSGLRDFLSIW